MGYNLYLKGSEFNRDAWLDEIETKFVGGEPGAGLAISGIGHQLGNLDEGLDREQLWLHPVGGIRGVTVWNEGGETRLSLPTGCSDVDYAFAWELMRMGVGHGATPGDEEDRDIDLSDNQIGEITNVQQQFEWSALVNQAGEAEEYALPVGGLIHLKISPADTAGGVEGLREILSGRMARYESAFVASLMSYSADGGSFTASNYGQIPSLIASEAEMISTQGDGGPVVDGVIPAEHFFSCIGDRVEDLGVFKYVPAIDLAAEPDLVAALKAGVAEFPASTGEGLTGEDWATLAKAPCLVFILVAAADGKVDAKEISIFGKILQSYDSLPSPVLAKIFGIAQKNLEGFIQEIVATGEPPQQQLMSLAQLLKSGKIPKEDAIVVAQGLLELGKAIASASGGFLGFGPKISKEEKQALAMLEMILVVGLM